MKNSIYREPILYAAACTVVGVLAARGVFNSMFAFPYVFALICLLFGALSLWRTRPRSALAARALILATGAALAVAGSMYQQRVIDTRIAERQLQVLLDLRGETVPALAGLEALNTEQAVWDEAASLTGKATLVTFWARWCSPCWKEMDELEALYREHKNQGLQVVAVTRYDTPKDADERRGDFEKAQRFLDKRQLTYPAAITDRDDIYVAYGIRSPPGLALVDAKGRIVDFAISLDRARELMETAVDMVAPARG